MKILVTGDYIPQYNRTLILINGLKKNKNVEVTEFPTNSNKTDILQLKRLIAGNDIIYLPPFTHKSVKVIRKLTSKPIVFDPLISKYLTKVFDYKLVFKYSPRALKNFYKDKIPLQISDLIIADTEQNKNYYIKKFSVDPRKIFVLPVGVDTRMFYPVETKVNKDTFIVGFYGGFIPLQGVTKIVEAAIYLKDEKDIKFNLIGDGFEFEKVKKIILKNNLTNVELSGYTEYGELNNKLNSFDLCLGIFGDTLKTEMVIPNKIFHYAALKKCIITKDTPAIKEIFTDQKNIILSSNDPIELANKILKLKNNKKLREQIAQGAYDLISFEYNEEKIAQKFINSLCNFFKK